MLYFYVTMMQSWISCTQKLVRVYQSYKMPVTAQTGICHSEVLYDSDVAKPTHWMPYAWTGNSAMYIQSLSLLSRIIKLTRRSLSSRLREPGVAFTLTIYAQMTPAATVAAADTNAGDWLTARSVFWRLTELYLYHIVPMAKACHFVSMLWRGSCLSKKTIASVWWSPQYQPVLWNSGIADPKAVLKFSIKEVYPSKRQRKRQPH